MAATECWSIGILEYWFEMVESDDGVAGRNPHEAVGFSAHYSTTPLLHHSVTPSNLCGCLLHSLWPA